MSVLNFDKALASFTDWIIVIFLPLRYLIRARMNSSIESIINTIDYNIN